MSYRAEIVKLLEEAKRLSAGDDAAAMLQYLIDVALQEAAELLLAESSGKHSPTSGPEKDRHQ